MTAAVEAEGNSRLSSYRRISPKARVILHGKTAGGIAHYIAPVIDTIDVYDFLGKGRAVTAVATDSRRAGTLEKITAAAQPESGGIGIGGTAKIQQKIGVYRAHPAGDNKEGAEKKKTYLIITRTHLISAEKIQVVRPCDYP